MPFEAENKRQLFVGPVSRVIGIAALAAACVFTPADATLLRAQADRAQIAIQPASPTGFSPTAMESVSARDDSNLPSFEVASIKTRVQDNPSGKGIPVVGGPDVSQFRASNATAKALIAVAYGVREFQVSGGPGWVDSIRFDIDAKVEDSLAAQLQKLPIQQQEVQQALMVRSLLLDRFKLRVTQGSKEGTVLALVVAKAGAAGLKEAPSPDPDGSHPPPYLARTPRGTLREVPPGQTLVMMNLGRASVAANGQPIGVLVNILSTLLGQQVVDKTGLAGNYQFSLQYAAQGGFGPDGAPLPPGPETPVDDSTAPPLSTALKEQLGLKLESAKGAIKTVTIDRIEEPSEN